MKSVKALLDELVEAVQDIDSYFGRSGGSEDATLRSLEKIYRQKRRAVREMMLRGKRAGSKS